MDIGKMRIFINAHKWGFAKTYADTAPHEYIVKTDIDEQYWKAFEDIVVFIRENGFNATFENKTYIYLIVDEYYYWTMGALVGETVILNRALLLEYELSTGKWSWKNRCSE